MSKMAEDNIRRWREHPADFVREVFGVEPDPWQIDVLEAFPHNQRLAMQACKGPGKAQPHDTPIPTANGTVLFGDLNVGDEIFTADGSVTRVKAIYERGVLPVFRVAFDDGSSTLACGEHLWKVRGRTERRHDTWSVLSTKEIIDRGIREKNGKWAGRHFEIPRQGAVEMPTREFPIDPYALGVWIGDGVRGSGRYSTKAIDEIKPELIRRGFKVSVTKYNTPTIFGIAKHLRALGLKHLYSYEKFIPENYKLGSVQQRRDLLCGLMDADGGIGDDGHMEYSTTSERLAHDVVWIVRSLGGVSYLKATVKRPYYRTPNGEIVHGKPCYRVTVTVPFNPFLLAHRRDRWKDPSRSPSTIRYMTRKIDAITEEGTQNCRCIEVEHESKLYLTNDFIVTHNTCLLAWLAWNFLATRPYPKIAATSITADTLADTLWTEMAKWQQKSPFLIAAFEWQKTRIFSKQYPETWWMSARSWSKTADATQQANTLAGLHADFILFLIDEAGGVPDAVMAAAEAALSSCVEGHLVIAGNPTHLSGPLYRSATTERRLWHITEITADPDDPKRTPRVSTQWAKEQIEKYGRDNPWVLINVFGRFPLSSLNVLIGPDEVTASFRRYHRDLGNAPRVLGVDVAREGDDASVIAKRQGLQVFPLRKLRNIDGIQGAGIVSREWQDWNAQACFIDMTGGFGSAWFDQLKQLGRTPISVQFSSAAVQSDRYYNKRTEMYFECVDWIRRGGALPESPEIMAALTQTEYYFKGDRVILQPKELIKAKIGCSPDEMDAIVCTFAAPVAGFVPAHQARKMHVASSEWKAFD